MNKIVNMKSITFILVLALLCMSCQKSLREQLPNISDEEIKMLEIIKKDYQANEIQLSKADTTDYPDDVKYDLDFEKTIVINILESKNVSVSNATTTLPMLSQLAHETILSLAEQADFKYDLIDIRFGEKTDGSTRYSGLVYRKDTKYANAYDMGIGKTSGFKYYLRGSINVNFEKVGLHGFKKQTDFQPLTQ